MCNHLQCNTSSTTTLYTTTTLLRREECDGVVVLHTVVHHTLLLRVESMYMSINVSTPQQSSSVVYIVLQCNESTPSTTCMQAVRRWTLLSLPSTTTLLLVTVAQQYNVLLCTKDMGDQVSLCMDEHIDLLHLTSGTGSGTSPIVCHYYHSCQHMGWTVAHGDPPVPT